MISRLIDINDFIYLDLTFNLPICQNGHIMAQFPHLINRKIEYYLLIKVILESSNIELANLLYIHNNIEVF